MRALPILGLLAAASPAFAGELSVVVQTTQGKPVRNAVVSLYPSGRPAALNPPQRVYQIVQKDIRFNPFVLIVPVGAQVAFPNMDPVRHHVYSFSQAKKFELKLYAREQNRAVSFEKPGVVPIGCNIHDQMAAFVKVVDTGLTGLSDGAGRVTFANIPPGSVIARIWHPYLRAPGNQIERRWSATPAPQTQTVTLSLRAPPPANAAY